MFENSHRTKSRYISERIDPQNGVIPRKGLGFTQSAIDELAQETQEKPWNYRKVFLESKETGYVIFRFPDDVEFAEAQRVRQELGMMKSCRLVVWTGKKRTGGTRREF